jgi:zinc protease
MRLVICFILACACGLRGGAQPLPLDPALRTGRLANGFTYFIRANHEPRSRVVLYLANRVGSMQEDDDQRGLAHFMEHMSFNGTRHYPKNQLVDYLQRSGVRFGADLNAYTNFTETVYQLPLPSDDTALLRHGLEIMRDWAAEASLDAAEIDAERGVVLEEKRLHNSAAQRLGDRAFPLLMNGTRYADRVPIGKEDILLHFKPEKIRRFYKDWYRPDLQALIVVGDIDVDEMERRIKRLFGDLKNPVQERPRIDYRIPLTGRNQFMALTDAEQASTQIRVLIKEPGSPHGTKEAYREELIRSFWNHALAERLRQLALEPDPAFTSAEAGVGGFLGGLDGLQVEITSKPGRTAAAFEAVWRELVRMREFGLTAGEFQRGKTAFSTSLENANAERDKTSSTAYTKEYLAWFLDSIAAPGIGRELELAKELLPDISINNVNAYGRTMIKDRDRDITIFAPEKEKDVLPDESTVNSWIAKVDAEKLSPPTEEALSGELLGAVPAGGKVVKRERIDSLGVTVLYLSNGVRVLLKPTDFKDDQVLFTAFGEGGSSVFPDSVFLGASNAARLVAAGGVGAFGSAELAKRLSGKTVQVTPYIQERYAGISGGMAVKDAETALQLVYLYCTAPRKDTLVFRNTISRARAALAGRGSSPEAVFGDSLNLILGNYHYRRRPLTPARLDSIRLEDAYTSYRSLFAGAGHFTFIFTGSLDTARLIPLLEKYLGGLPAANRVGGARGSVAARDTAMHGPGVASGPLPRVPEGRIVKTFYKGNDNKATVRLFYSGSYPYSEANNIQLSALGSILQYRMIDRIREAEGGAYSPKAGVELSKRPEERYLFAVQFVCAPQNVDKLIAAVEEEIARLKKEGPTAVDIQKFQAEQTREIELQLHSNGFWLQYLASALQNEEPLTGVLRYTGRLKEVSPKTVQQAAQLYLNDKNYIQLVLKPVQR